MSKQLHPPTKMTAEPTHLWVPDFITFDRFELDVLTNVLRDSDATNIYMLLREYSDFVTGEFLGGYHNLMALCTPPRPERGPRRPGPSYQTVRRVIEDLIKTGLVQRPDPTANALQGQLRLQLTHIFRRAAPVELNNRLSNRAAKGRTPRKSTACDESGTDTQQISQQGYQGVNTPYIPQTSAVIHSHTPPHGGEDSNSPPAGEGEEVGGGPVAAAPLRAGSSAEVLREFKRRADEIRKAKVDLKEVNRKAAEKAKTVLGKPSGRKEAAPVQSSAPKDSFVGVLDALPK